MQTLAWITDPHLDALSSVQRATFFESIASSKPEGVVITGDIAEGEALLPILEAFDTAIEAPIFFVLGNHDYYGGHVERVRQRIRDLCVRGRNLRWLPSEGVVELSSKTALVGHGGWSDGRGGDFLASPIRIRDYTEIQDLRDLAPEPLFRALRALGLQAARALEPHLEMALEQYQNILVATHSPPFVEACWYQGQAGINEWSPHFTCVAMGELLDKMAVRYSHAHLRVLCGHTHHAGHVSIRPNLEVFTGAAEYGLPALQPGIEIR